MCSSEKDHCTSGLFLHSSRGVETSDAYCRCNNIMQQSSDLMPWSRTTAVEHTAFTHLTRPPTAVKPRSKLQDSTVFYNYQFKHHDDISMFMNDYRKTHTIPNVKSKSSSFVSYKKWLSFYYCSSKKSNQHISCGQTTTG